MTTQPQVPPPQGGAPSEARPGFGARVEKHAPRWRSQGRTPSQDDQSKWRYGVIVICAGFATILACFIAAIEVFATANAAISVLAPVLTAVGSLVGAYFGIQAGTSRNAELDRTREREHQHALHYASLVDPNVALRMGSPTDQG